MLKSIITHECDTLLMDFPCRRMLMAEHLASIGIKKPAHEIRCADEEDEPIKVKIYGTSEFENRLASFVSSENTLSFVNTICEIYHNLPYANKLDMMDAVLNGKVSSFEEFGKMMLERRMMDTIERYYCPLTATLYPRNEYGDLENFSEEYDGEFLAPYEEKIRELIQYNAIYSAIANFFTVMGNMGAGIFDLSWVEATLKLFSMFGWSLFIAGLAVAIFDIAIEYQSMGRFNIKQQLMPIIYSFLAVNLFTVVPVRLYTLCITLQNTFMKDLAKLFSKDIVVSDGFGGQALAALNVINGNISVFTLLFVIALGYCVIKIFFANIKRGGILLTQIAVGSLYMFSIPKGYTDGFIFWMKQVIALCLTAFMQMTLLFLGLLTWQEDMLLGLGVMLAANEVPRIAQNFGLDTSMKVNVMSAVHTTTTAINLTRAIARK